jgi:hypothetical protein
MMHLPEIDFPVLFSVEADVSARRREEKGEEVGKSGVIIFCDNDTIYISRKNDAFINSGFSQLTKVEARSINVDVVCCVDRCC